MTKAITRNSLAEASTELAHASPQKGAMPAQFSVPDVEDNVEGWGPTSVPDHLSGVPYAPFGKGDRVGKISDFTQAGGKYGGEMLLQVIS